MNPVNFLAGRRLEEAAAAPWGGYFGYFSDLDGYLLKVACAQRRG